MMRWKRRWGHKTLRGLWRHHTSPGPRVCWRLFPRIQIALSTWQLEMILTFNGHPSLITISLVILLTFQCLRLTKEINKWLPKTERPGTGGGVTVNAEDPCLPGHLFCLRSGHFLGTSEAGPVLIVSWADSWQLPCHQVLRASESVVYQVSSAAVAGVNTSCVPVCRTLLCPLSLFILASWHWDGACGAETHHFGLHS